MIETFAARRPRHLKLLLLLQVLYLPAYAMTRLDSANRKEIRSGKRDIKWLISLSISPQELELSYKVI